MAGPVGGAHHCHVPQSATSLSPAATNSSGVITPFSMKALSVRTGVIVSPTACAKLTKLCIWAFFFARSCS
jgi:hypothetical protein|eukprot:COSAG06_NODE_3982_length_4690_cov_817.792420_6_plen_71_part_00